MAPRFRFRLPSFRDWAWILGLLLAGAALGFGLNPLSPNPINLAIALAPQDEAPPPEPASTPEPSPAGDAAAAEARP